jgi:hypothetical protein
MPARRKPAASRRTSAVPARARPRSHPLAELLRTLAPPSVPAEFDIWPSPAESRRVH